MARRVLIVDDSFDLNSLTPSDVESYSDLILLCWLAPDTLASLYQRCPLNYFSLLDVVGSLERWEKRAIALTESICLRGPSYRGLPWRTLLTETLFREALVIQAVLDADELCRRLAGDEPSHLDLRVSSELNGLFEALRRKTNAATSPVPLRRASLLQRLGRRLRRVLLLGDARGQLWNLLDQMDATYRWRTFFWRILPAHKTPSGEPLLFSSYLNNSKTLKAFEPYLSGKIHWIVTNRYARLGATGDDSARRGGGAMTMLWRSASLSSQTVNPPDDHEVDPIDESHPEPVAGILRTWLASSPAWQYWHRHGQEAMWRLTQCWEGYLEEARPSLVAVANQWGLEGWFTRLAQQRGIPVVQLLHGVMGGELYTGKPVLSDAMVVWGEQWRALWPVDEQKNIHVFHPHAVFTHARRQASAKRRITYFSWPFDRLPFYNDQELMGRFIALFQGLLEEDSCELTLRAHPLENLADLMGRWQKQCGSVPEDLHLSQQESLAEVLAQTDIAVMFRSTVMLDCFASGIPIVMPAWIDFPWSGRLRALQGVHLAEDFGDLERTLKSWMEEPPTLLAQETQGFLRPEEQGEEAFRQLLDSLSSDSLSSGSISSDSHLLDGSGSKNVDQL